MEEMKPIMSVVTIDIYRLNFIIKRQRLSDFIKKKKKKLPANLQLIGK